MNANYKKALGPDLPDEKQVGKAISPPPCERGVPIYPVRYGIAPYALDREVFPTLSTENYPELAAGKAYGLRVLRPATYVYLCYFENGRMWTLHYQVTDEVRFARISWGRADDNDSTPGRLASPDSAGAKSFLLVPEAKAAEIVYVMVSDTLLSHRILWDIETNKDGLRDALCTQCRPTAGTNQNHAFDAVLLGKATRELVPKVEYGAPTPFEWSEIQFSENAPSHNNILGNMYIALLPRKDIKPLAVALQDPIGMASELHYLVTGAVTRKTEYAGKNAHKLQSATLITNYFEAMKKQAANDPNVDKTLARQRSLVNYASAISFPSLYAIEIKTFERTIAETVKDSIVWVRLFDPSKLLGKALRCFDLGVIHNAHDYEHAVFQCIGGLVHADSGIQELADLIAMPPDRSPYWLALANGNDVLLARLRASAGDIAKNAFNVMDKFIEEHKLTTASNALIGLLQALPETRQADVLVPRLRHVMEIRASFTIVSYDLTMADLQRAAYQYQGYLALGEEGLRGWKIPTPKVSHTDLTVRVSVFDWIKVGETTYYPGDQASGQPPGLPAPRAIRMEGNPFINMLNRLRGPGGRLFTGLGGFLALKGLSNAWRSLKRSDDIAADYVSLYGATSAIVAASIEIGTSIVAVGAAAQGNKTLALRMAIIAANRGVALFGAGAAGLSAVADAIKSISAFRDRNPEHGGMLLGSALAGGVLTVATWAGGTATVATLIGGVGAGIVLGLHPAGWAIIAGVSVTLLFGFAFGAEMNKHGPVEIWLKHSAWGVHGRHYSNREELNAVHSLYSRPRLTPEWTKASGYAVGSLRISCQIPEMYDYPGEGFQARLSLTLRGKELSQVVGPIAYAPGTNPVDYERECVIGRLGAAGNECGWMIFMHEDAKVALEYLYFPNPDKHPGLALRQPDAPEPLVFTSGGWFTDLIDPSKLDPVGPPK